MIATVNPAPSPINVFLPMPHQGQRQVRITAKRFNAVCAGRRWRKTSMLASIFVEACLAKSNQLWVWGAPTFSQTLTAMDEIKKMCAHPEIAIHKLSPRPQSLFFNGSKIYYLSLDTFDNIRSLTANGVGVDEAQDIQREAWSEVLRPMLIDTGGPAWLIGTSKGKNWFWQERQAFRESPADSATWNAPTLGVEIVGGKLIRKPHPLENPFIPFSEALSFYRSVPAHVFRREFMSDDDAAPGDLIYDIWADGYPELSDGNVTLEADYQSDNGRIYWGVDDGYTGHIDPVTRTFTAGSHPRVFLLCQLRPNGVLCVFDEVYKVETLPIDHLNEVLSMGYPIPEFAAVDKSAAALKGQIAQLNIYTRNGGPYVKEGIKVLRQWVGADANGVRKILVHPRCRHLRFEMANYRNKKGTDDPAKEFDHGPDALRYLIWNMRLYS